MSTNHALKKVNLGCGQFPKAGFVNVDWDKSSGAEVIHDLNVLPLPFGAGECMEVRMEHVLEHLSDVFGTLREIHRILAPGGKVVIRVPHFSRGLTHPEHKRGFDVSFPFYFNPSFPGGYTGVPFECASIRLRWCAQPYLKRKVLGNFLSAGLQAMGFVIDLFANLSPGLCSRVWCFWAGGFEEVEFELVKAES